jgi:tetratricopeptide (TPR) repeat protein
MNDWFEAEHHIERAHEHYENGRWDEAETELREALALNPYRPEWHFNLGLTLDAAKAFRDCHTLESEDPQVLLLIGTNLMRAGEVRGSIEWFEKAHKSDATNVQSLVKRIEAHAMLGEHEQAEVMFYMSQQVDARNAEALAAMADSLLARNLVDKAVWCLREAASLDPSIPGVHSKLAHAYASTGRLERARQLYLRELRADPGDIDTLLDLGCLLRDMNRAQEAGEKFRRVLEIEPDNADAHFYLAELCERSGDLSGGLEHYDVVLRLDASFPGARRRLARMLLNARDERVRDHGVLRVRELLDAEVALAEAQTDQEVVASSDELYELAQTLMDAQRPDEARRVLRRALDCRPNDIQAMHLYSVACFTLGGRQREQGIEACRGVLRLDPRFVPAIHNMAVAYSQMRHWKRARYWVRQGLRIEPEDAALRRLRLKLRLALGLEAWHALRFMARTLNPLRPTREA